MRLAKTVTAFLFFISPLSLLAQEDEWDVYMAQYEKGAGSTLVNMSLKKRAPVKEMPFVLVTGVKFIGCADDGMPTKNEFTSLYKISDSVQAIVEKFFTHKLAGTFTYQCERLDYYYIADTANLRKELTNLYSRLKIAEPYINIKPDKEWEAYLGFLYPNEEISEYMQDEKVVMQLYNAGDKLEKERQVDHWIYFSSEADLSCFTNYVKEHDFKVEAKEKTDDADRPYKLQISRVDKVDMSSITRITLTLRKEAQKCNGDYDGWETFVIK